MVPEDASRILQAESRPRHPRIAIRIREVDVTADENLAVIRAPRREDQRRKN
jgi:hypothetical protein